MKKIYLATPYSHPDRGVRVARFQEVNKVAAMLLKEDMIVYSPISQMHVLAEDNNLPTNWQFWGKFDTAFIEWADRLIVLQQHGWENSRGVREEIKIARSFRKSIRYLKSYETTLTYNTNRVYGADE